ncbi:hypothetical protein [Methanobrevibacter oralis]|uniref:hypothetical protein n=1 Tax=Methanobrevibacter oralis TaxID=66851 RepID=UPI001C73A08F|nr:hypothetical protein [Methanobrevibacter oralis]
MRMLKLNGTDVEGDLYEWSKLITDLGDKEVKYYNLKEKYNELSENIIVSTDFKELYGKNNETVRKNHVKNELSDMVKDIKSLEFDIDYCKRRISFLKQLIHTKTVLLQIKN